MISGGFGSAVLETLADAGLADAELRGLPVRLIGLPGAKFVDHASASDLRRVLRIDEVGITEQIREALATLDMRPAAQQDYEARTA